MTEDAIDRASAARRLIRSRSHAALATSLDGRAYVSLVAVACDSDACPLLLLSDLAQHTRNLRAEPRVSLLFEDTGGFDDPLAGPRLSLLGTAERLDDAAASARFTRRHPSSTAYAGFGDFHLYRVKIERGHLVAGFGQINWVEGAELRFTGDGSALSVAEAEIVAHMNSDHADALDLYAARLLGKTGSGWQMTGIDPDGIDLLRGGETARLDFAEPVLSPAAARRALVGLAEKSRTAASPS